MSETVIETIEAKYPKIFSHRASAGVSGGWIPLLDTLCQSIQSYIDGVEEARAYAMNKNLMLARAKEGDWTMFDDHMAAMTNRIWVDTERERFTQSLPLPVPELVPQLVAVQVKEKFGSLRFYARGGDQYTQGLIDMTENMSCIICEECGVPGTRGGTQWIKTRCDLHRN